MFFPTKRSGKKWRLNQRWQGEQADQFNGQVVFGSPVIEVQSSEGFHDPQDEQHQGRYGFADQLIFHVFIFVVPAQASAYGEVAMTPIGLGTKRI